MKQIKLETTFENYQRTFFELRVSARREFDYQQAAKMPDPR